MAELTGAITLGPELLDLILNITALGYRLNPRHNQTYVIKNINCRSCSLTPVQPATTFQTLNRVAKLTLLLERAMSSEFAMYY